MSGDPEYADFQEAIAETMNACNEEFGEKADNIAKLIKQLESDADAAGKEAARIKSRQTAFENNAKNLRLMLKQAMHDSGKTKFKTLLYTFSISKNSPCLDSYAPDKIPGEYFKIPEPVLDRNLLLEDLKKGVEVPGAAIKQGESLRIR